MLNKNVTEGNIFQFSGTFYKNNALVIAYHTFLGIISAILTYD